MQAKAATRQQSLSKTPGLCANTANCAVARSGKPVMVALNQPFRCPSCGNPLTAPDPSQMRRSLVLPLLAGGGALLLLFLAVLWFTAPKAANQAAAPHAAPAVQTAALVAPNAAPGGAPGAAPAAPPPPIAEDQLGSSPPNPAIVGSSGPGGPTSADQPMPQPGQVLHASAPPAEPSPTAPPGEPSKSVEAAPAPDAAGTKAAVAKHQHRVVAALARRRLQGGEASGEMLPTDGSRPDYPTEYEDDGEQGTVAVTCIIMPDGHATGCRVNARTGGPRFAASVQRWLDRDATRFPPMVKNGHPAPARFTWNIQFFP